MSRIRNRSILVQTRVLQGSAMTASLMKPATLSDKSTRITICQVFRECLEWARRSALSAEAVAHSRDAAVNIVCTARMLARPLAVLPMTLHDSNTTWNCAAASLSSSFSVRCYGGSIVICSPDCGWRTLMRNFAIILAINPGHRRMRSNSSI